MFGGTWNCKLSSTGKSTIAYIRYLLQLTMARMIKTGDWSIVDLVKYLVAVQQTLSAVELERLKHTAAFPKEVPAGTSEEEKLRRYQAGDLYEPLETLRSLQLPILDWDSQTKWRASSEEGKMRFDLLLNFFDQSMIQPSSCSPLASIDSLHYQ